MNLAELTDDVLIRLGRALNTQQFAAVTGTGGAKFSTEDVIRHYLNEAQNDLARMYCKLEDIATYTWPESAILAKYSLFTCTILPGNIPFAVISLSWNGTELTAAGRGAMANWDPGQQADSDGNPLYFASDTEGVILSAPAPQATAVNMNVMTTPQPLVNTVDTPQFPADRHYLLSLSACEKLLIMRRDSPELQTRGKDFGDEYRSLGAAIWWQLYRQDPDLANLLGYAATAFPPQGQAAQGQ